MAVKDRAGGRAGKLIWREARGGITSAKIDFGARYRQGKIAFLGMKGDAMKKVVCGGVLASLLVLIMTGCAIFGDMNLSDKDPADAQLEKDVLVRLSQDPVTAPFTFGVLAQDGVVTLQGSVASENVRARAVAIAQGTPGVENVVNRIYRRETQQFTVP